MLQKKEINAGVAQCRSLPNAILVDVRNDFEYAGGHIPGALNLALSRVLKEAEEFLPDKGADLFIYCQSGARSARAAKLLELLGYGSVTDLGGITGYAGSLEK